MTQQETRDCTSLKSKINANVFINKSICRFRHIDTTYNKRFSDIVFNWVVKHVRLH